MLHQNQNNSVLTVSSPDANFTPRREFVRDNHVTSSFALLAIAGTSLVRLSSFPTAVKDALYVAFGIYPGLRSFRSDEQLDLFEFNLEEKPWSNSKNIHSERLLLEILTVIFKHGFKFVSPIDYGREADDRLCIVFSKPTIAAVQTGSRPASEIALVQIRLPFAVSFVSTTTLRVINPPLNSTPAILQGVRAAWPRGVVTDRKAADGCFEFKLKGYKWFEEDTFPTDSLQLILSLLSALDHHAFSLLTSVSISGSRSRVKDLWIFCGPPQEMPIDSPIFGGPNAELAGQPFVRSHKLSLPSGAPSAESPQPEGHHVRSPSAPVGPSSQHFQPSHSRSATEPSPAGPSIPHAILRKRVSPKGSAPSSPLAASAMRPGESTDDENTAPRMANKESSTSSVDMTGVGAAGLRRSSEMMRTASPEQHMNGYGWNDQRPKTGDIFYSTPLPTERGRDYAAEAQHDGRRHSPPTGNSSAESDSSGKLVSRETVPPPTDVPQSVYGQVPGEDTTPPILNPGTFRDSAFSSNTRYSYEIPITWTGGLEGDRSKDKLIAAFASSQPTHAYFTNIVDNRNGGHSTSESAPPRHERYSGLNLPGAWQPAPVMEEPEDTDCFQDTDAEDEDEHEHERPSSSSREQMPERKDVDAARVASPTSASSAAAMRRSEVASMGMVSRHSPQSTSPHASPGTTLSSGASREFRSASAPPSPGGLGGGWVLVNVESSRAKSDPLANQLQASYNCRRPSGDCRGSGGGIRATPPPLTQPSSMSPVAKAIAAADAMAPATEEAQSKGLRRIFTKSKSRRPSGDSAANAPSERKVSAKQKQRR